MHLNAEALVLPVAQEKPAPPALRSFAPLAATIPCDFHILNLRTLQAEVSRGQVAGGSWGAHSCHPQHRASRPRCQQDDSLPSAEAALILHRKGFDCSLEARNLGFNCTTTQGKVGAAACTLVGSELCCGTLAHLAPGLPRASWAPAKQGLGWEGGAPRSPEPMAVHTQRSRQSRSAPFAGKAGEHWFCRKGDWGLAWALHPPMREGKAWAGSVQEAMCPPHPLTSCSLPSWRWAACSRGWSWAPCSPPHSP